MPENLARRHRRRNCELRALPRRTRPESFPVGRNFPGLGPAERRREQLPNGKSRHGLVPARRRPPGSCRCRLTPRSPGACRTRRLSTATRWGGRARRTKATRLPRGRPVGERGPSCRRERPPRAVRRARLARASLRSSLGPPETGARHGRANRSCIFLGYVAAGSCLADQPWKRLTRTSRRKMDTCCAVPAQCLAPCASGQRDRPATARRGCRGVLREGGIGARQQGRPRFARPDSPLRRRSGLAVRLDNPAVPNNAAERGLRGVSRKFSFGSVNGARLAGALRFVFGMLTGPYRRLPGDLRARRRGPPPEDPAAWLPPDADGQRLRSRAPSLPQGP